MNQKYTLQHIGYPTTERIPPEAWKDYSKHSSLWACIRKMDKCREHLGIGQWDDHYRILSPEGKIVDWEDVQKERYLHLHSHFK